MTDHTSQQDALWFALGANRENGQRMTRGDVRHAVLLALQTWGNNKTLTAIAKQIGVPLTTAHTWQSQFFQTEELKPRDRVTGQDGKSYAATRQVRSASNLTGQRMTLRLPGQVNTSVHLTSQRQVETAFHVAAGYRYR